MSLGAVQDAGSIEWRRHDGRLLVPIPEQEALGLLASVDFGRLVFTEHALPAVRPLNHIVDDGEVVVRTRLGSRVATRATPPVVDVFTYEADDIDAEERVGWSVVVTGRAAVVTDPERLQRCADRLRPWVDLPMDVTIAIRPEIITGVRLVRRAHVV